MNRIGVIAGLTVLAAAAALAQQEPAVVCDGTPFSYFTQISGGEDESPAQLNEEAKQKLETEVLDRCFGSLVSSATQIERSQIVRDRTIVSLEGEITEYAQIEWRRIPQAGGVVETEQTFELTARLAVHVPPGNADPGFNVTATTDRVHYVEGDSLRISITLSQPAYLYIFDVSDGVVGQIFPNKYAAEDAPFLAGDWTFPSDRQRAAGQAIRLSANPGRNERNWTDSFVVVATKQALDMSQSGIGEETDRPLTLGQTGGETQLSKAVFKRGLRRDEIAQTYVTVKVEQKVRQP
jgi:hypothetical protein